MGGRAGEGSCRREGHGNNQKSNNNNERLGGCGCGSGSREKEQEGKKGGECKIGACVLVGGSRWQAGLGWMS
jgi:hypothetical protein